MTHLSRNADSVASSDRIRNLDAGHVPAPPSASLRVAAIIDTKIVSGPGRQLAALGASLSSRGVEFLVIGIQRQRTPLSPYIDYLAECGVRHVVVYESGRVDPALVRRVGRVLSEFGPDVVETHGYKPTAIVAALRIGAPRWKWMGFWHGETNENWKVRVYNRVDRSLIRFADHVVAMSKQQEALLARLGAQVSVISNAVLPRGFASGPRRLVVEEEMLRPLLGVVGRLSSEKGVDVFLRAAANLAARGIPFSAIIVGDGPDRQALDQLTRELGLEARVRFLGSRADVASIYEVIDLLVIPSRSEGLPNVLLEALAHDRPVVATRVGAIPEVLDSELAGGLVESENPTALADAILAAAPLMVNPEAVTARKRVVSRFSLERRVEAHLQLYSSLVENAR